MIQSLRLPAQNVGISQTAPAEITWDLPRGSGLMARNIRLNLQGTVTIGVAPAASLALDGVPSLVRNVSLELNGRRVWEIGGGAANILALVGNGVAPTVNQPALAVAAQTYSCIIDLGRAWRSLFNKRDFMSQLFAAQSAVLRVTFDPLTSMLVLGGGTTLTNTALTCAGIVEMTPLRVSEAGVIEKAWELSYRTIQASGVAAVTDFVHTLRLGNSFVHGLLVRQQAANVLVDTVVTQVRIAAGSNDIEPWQTLFELRAKCMSEMGVTTPVGYVYIPAAVDGRMREAWQIADIGDVDVHVLLPGIATSSYEIIPVFAPVDPVVS